MNISSMIVYVDEAQVESVKDDILKLSECEIVASESDKIVVVSETKSSDYQIAIFRCIERFAGVKSVAMVYSYEELDDSKIASEISKNLSDEVDVKDVVYGGSVGFKI